MTSWVLLIFCLLLCLDCNSAGAAHHQQKSKPFTVKGYAHLIEENNRTKRRATFVYLTNDSLLKPEYLSDTTNRMRTSASGYFEFSAQQSSSFKYVMVKAINRVRFVPIDKQIDSMRITLEVPDMERPIAPAKPVIYLYPETQTVVDVKLDFMGKVITTYPEYKKGWRVIAQPDGMLKSIDGKQQYAYLFWDGEITFPAEHYRYKKGFCVAAKHTAAFFEQTLAAIGLNTKEANDFIVYWLPIMQRNKYNIIHFWVDDNYDNSTFLNIQPKPQSELRVFMEFKSTEEPVSIHPQQFKPFERKGFTVVEWGGAEIDKHINKLQ